MKPPILLLALACAPPQDPSRWQAAAAVAWAEHGRPGPQPHVELIQGPALDCTDGLRHGFLDWDEEGLLACYAGRSWPSIGWIRLAAPDELAPGDSSLCHEMLHVALWQGGAPDGDPEHEGPAWAVNVPRCQASVMRADR